MSAKEDKSLRESVHRIEEARRSGAASLDLSGLNLSTVPDSLAQLPNLQTLNLSGNQITAIPHSFTQLTNLRSLDLGFNRITPIPDSLARLANLQMLKLKQEWDPHDP